MTFTESIYRKVSNINSVSTDDFSIDWLGQSRSYYSSLKARHIEASNAALVKLMNKLTEQKQVMEMGNKHPHLQMVARKYDALAKEFAVELANRATKQNLGNIQVRGLLMKAITDLHDKAHPTAPPIIIC